MNSNTSSSYPSIDHYTYPESLSLCVSLSPFFTLMLTKEGQRLLLLIASGDRPTSTHPTLSLPSQPPRFPSGGCIDLGVFLQPKCFPKSQRINKTKVRVPGSYLNNRVTIMRACRRTASRDFQHAGRKAEELDARRLRIGGVFVFPLLAREYGKGERETYGRRR